VNDRYGVKDTNDNTEEFYIARKLINMCKKAEQKGIRIVRGIQIK
jgi:hypothetical protein